jgi:hypothetical protein
MLAMVSWHGAQQRPAPHRLVISPTLDAPAAISCLMVQSVTPTQ